MQPLFDMLNSIHRMPPKLQKILSDNLGIVHLNKRDWLLREGEVSSKVYFIRKGFVRCYYIDDNGEEVTSWFMKEGDVIFSVESFLEQTPGHEFIIALEESELYHISFRQLNLIYRDFIVFNVIGRVLTEKYYMLSLRRAYRMRKKSYTERYRLCLLYEPEILLRAPLKDVASYLGMSVKAISRIRSENLSK